jgi:hypothetical protein
MPTIAPPIHIRFIFPRVSRCPSCDHDKHRRQVSRPGTAPARAEYRNCAECGTRYRVVPIGKEVDDGGAWSRIIPT